jgi:hypothetical protein
VKPARLENAADQNVKQISGKAVQMIALNEDK